MQRTHPLPRGGTDLMGLPNRNLDRHTASVTKTCVYWTWSLELRNCGRRDKIARRSWNQSAADQGACGSLHLRSLLSCTSRISDSVEACQFDLLKLSVP